MSVPEPDDLVMETRHRWVPTEPVPEGWRSGNQCFVGEFLEVFVYDPAVPYIERKADGSTDRWIKFRKIDERRCVSPWREVVTPSRTDRQPPTSVAQAKGGQGPADGAAGA